AGSRARCTATISRSRTSATNSGWWSRRHRRCGATPDGTPFQQADPDAAAADDGDPQPGQGIGEMAPYQPAQDRGGDDLQVDEGRQQRCGRLAVGLDLQQ